MHKKVVAQKNKIEIDFIMNKVKDSIRIVKADYSDRCKATRITNIISIGSASKTITI